MRIAAQLYTVRDLLARDIAGTLRRVSAAGYEHVELASHGPCTAGQLAKLLADCGLSACSEHCAIERLESNLNAAMDDAHALGVRFIVCPYLPEERRRTETDWRACAELLNRAGEVCRANHLQLCYHNHSFEFVAAGGRTALELLYAETSPEYLQAELDTYWIRHGGGNPAEWLVRLAGRCPLLHLKDMTADAARDFAPVGAGILEWPRIFAAAKDAHVQWGIVEQDACRGDPIAALAESRGYLVNAGFPVAPVVGGPRPAG